MKNHMFYVGEFSGGIFHGKGLLVHENKDYYLGGWKNGKAEGRG